MPAKEGKSIWELIFEQLDDLFVKILLLAALISFVTLLRTTNNLDMQAQGGSGSTDLTTEIQFRSALFEEVD
ncbi:hypothetical protein ANCCEY_08231 [Ancylostoma ceylanicum]|uniref:Cation-transporting P-type ATPase N-terminal domain-containing protein n=1 Tax=Ancylostoma ceylanicum TaxID=53326 RepID=A0A0D6LN93_9BILA|nr:hypothetical protein ANCCEY_08231 [Ancylostoma ceylanicum]